MPSHYSPHLDAQLIWVNQSGWALRFSATLVGIHRRSERQEGKTDVAVIRRNRNRDRRPAFEMFDQVGFGTSTSKPAYVRIFQVIWRFQATVGRRRTILRDVQSIERLSENAISKG